MFQKIYRYMRILVIYALLLMSVLILSLLYAALQPVSPAFFIAAIAVTFLAVFLVYLIFARIARVAAKSITEPIERAAEAGFSDSGHMYEEIKPLLSRLTTQDSEIKRQSDKAKSQKLQLKTVTSNMNEGLIILDGALHVLSVNRCAQEILGIQERDVKYKSLLSVPESELFAKSLYRAAEGINSDFLFPSGSKTYQMYFTPVFENEDVSGVVILLFDVSARHRAEQIRREFSANVSHELKTPLTTIFGYSQIITTGMAKPEDIKGFAEKIEKETARLITLIDDIIALSALEENGTAIEKETVSLRDITEEVFEALESRAKQQSVTLALTDGDTAVSANRGQMAELIFNLCDNAIKYNKPGGSVTVSIARSTLTVADTGIGIPPDSIERLFERFYRVDKSHSKKVNGTGLGLSIVKHIAQNHDAEIAVKSILGEGSTFTVIFK